MSLSRSITLLSGAACGAVLALLIYVAIMSAPMDADSTTPTYDPAPAAGGAQ